MGIVRKLGHFVIGGALAVVAGFVLAPVHGAAAKELRYVGINAIPSMDPAHSAAAGVVAFLSNIYEPLVDLSPDGKAVGKLAVSWEQAEPTRWRFHLRQGVKFHDGSPFTADDVVFSINRAMSKNATLQAVVKNIVKAEKVDDYTVDLFTRDADILQPSSMYLVKMLSKQWSEKNNAVEPVPKVGNDTNYAVRNADGTGPFSLAESDPGVSATLKVNDSWWGGKRTDQMTSAKYVIVSSGATAIAALLSGDVDLVSSLSPNGVDLLQKTPGIKLVSESGLVTIHFGWDLSRPELVYSSVKGKNPFQDLRVRQAFDMAIDRQAIVDRIYRGFGAPAGWVFSKWIPGYDAKLAEPTKLDVDKAKSLMSDAGYKDGFSVELDCTDGSYLNDVDLCQAVAAMLAKINVTVNVKTFSSPVLADKTQSRDTSFWLGSYATSTYDAVSSALSLFGMVDPKTGSGAFNMENYANKTLDDLVVKARATKTMDDRIALIKQIFSAARADLPLLPVTYEPVIWAMKDNVTAKVNPLNRILLSDVTLN